MNSPNLGRLVIDCSSARIGYGAAEARNLARRIAALRPGHEFDLALTKAFAGPIRESLPAEAHVLRIPSLLSPAPLRLGWQQVSFPQHLRRIRPTWVLAPFGVLPLAPPTPDYRSAMIVSSVAPFSPMSETGLAIYRQLRLATLRRLIRASMHRADLVFFLSKQSQEIVGTSEAQDSVVLPVSPPDPSVIREARRIQPSLEIARPLITIVGDLYPHKGVEDAILAVADLASRGSDAQLQICGEPFDRDYAQQLRRLAQDLAPDAVQFRGKVNHEQALAMIGASVVTLVCSRVESLGSVPIEAMAMETPILVADTPVAREVCGEAALYYEPGDHHRLADLLTELLYAEEARRALVARAQELMAGVDWLSSTRTLLGSMGSI